MAEPSQSSAAIWIGPIVSWLLVIAGWIVINAQNNRRETRKEIRAALDELYEMLNSVEDDAFTYHTGTGDAALSRRIKRQVGQIFARVNLAFQDAIECRCAREITAFRKAVTLRNFDTAGHQSLAKDDPVFEEITGTRERLVLVLERAFLARYR